MKSESNHYRMFTRRAALLAGAQGLLGATLVGRMYYLGVMQSGQYQMLAEDNRVSLRLLPPVRGEIFDRFGVPLASNRQDYRVFLIPEQAHDVTETLKRLGRVIALSESDVARIMRQIKRQREFLPVTVAQNLDWNAFARLNVQAPDLPGIQPDSGLTRYYPHDAAASPLIGYVGAASEEELDGDPLLSLPGFKIGKRGIEKAFDSTLRGKAGSTRVEVNAYGRVIRELGRTAPESGDAIALTIDMELQRYVNQRLGEESAAAIVMSTRTGEIMAYGSTPTYDPNDFTFGISRENWLALLRDPRKPLIDKCLSGQYPPGSTIKPIVALAALEDELIDPEETVYCPGKYTLGDRTFHCWRERGHGRVNLVEAISGSCDVYFYRLAQKVGIDRMGAMLHAFGLGETFAFELPGQARGLVPGPGWKLSTTGERWHTGETLVVGIGQGALLATPLQMVTATARIANGGLPVRPTVVRNLQAGDASDRAMGPRLAIKSDHFRLVQRGMEGVLERGGTAYLSRLRMEGVAMAGKTGTAQVQRISEQERETGLVDNEDKPWNERDHAWFIAYAPTDQPQYAVCVLVEHGGGGSKTAAPIARDIMARTIELDPINRIPADLATIADGPATPPAERG